MFKNIKTVAFPKEHGSWGLTFEPLTLALIVNFSYSGLLLFLGATFAFLAHQPARILLTNNNQRKLALMFLLIYGIPASIFLLLFFQTTHFPAALPLLFALLLMLFYLIAEYFRLHRALATELMASMAIGLMAFAIVLSGGWPISKALPFLVLLYLRSLSTTLYVHFRLKLERKLPLSLFWAQTWQFLTLLVVLFLFFTTDLPFLAFLSIVILAFRGFYGLSPWRKPMTVKQIGLAEFVYGLIFVTFSALGYLL